MSSHLEKPEIEISEESLKLACLSLKESLPELTPSLLKRILIENYTSTNQRIELVSVKQASQFLGVCEMTVYRMAATGRLKKYPIGNGRSFRLNKFELLD